MPENAPKFAIRSWLIGWWALGCAATCALTAVAVGAANYSTGRGAAMPYIIDSWQTDDGLPQNSVTSIIQTRDGYLWFGTLNGLVRFDGVRFVVFDENNTPGLNSSRIVRLFEDRAGNLWVGTETGGVARIKDGQVTSFPIGQGVSSQCLATVCEDAGGAVWLYTKDGQLWRYGHERFTVFSFGLDYRSECRMVMAEKAGPLWLGTDSRLSAIGLNPDPGPLEHQVQQDVAVTNLNFLVPGAKGGYWRIADRQVQKFAGGRLERDLGRLPFAPALVGAACEDLEGNLVVGMLGPGILWYGAEGAPMRLTTGDGLKNDVILSLCVDREGNLWVGTDGGGLSRVRRQGFTVVDERHGLAAKVVQSVAEDAQGGLWIGSNGGGLNYLKEGAPKHYGRNEGLTNLHVWSVLVDRDQRVWAGTWGGGVFRGQNGHFGPVPGAQALNAVVLAIHEDRVGDIWLGTQGGLARLRAGEWKLYTKGEGLSADEVRAMADDAEGNLWIGTRGGGLNRLRDGRFTTFHKADGLPSEDISSLYVDSEGILWIGTFGSGLGRFQGNRFTRYSTQDGLAGNSIGALLEDGHGYLWIGSNAGLMRARKRDLDDFAGGQRTAVHCRLYAKPDGLPTRECTIGAQPGACRSRDGRLWFPTVKGLVAVQPAQLYVNTNRPPVIIESATLDGQELSTNTLRMALPPSLAIPPGWEHLEIHYTGLSLSAPERARFKYRLEGHEEAWVEAGASRSARYSKLPPGHYRFQVIAGNEDDVWNEQGATLALTIQPPIWRTWWFLSAVAASILGAIAASVHYVSTQKLQRQLARLQHEEAIEKERARIARDIHDHIGASLTQITLLSELARSDKDLPEEVENHTQQISETARQLTRTLDEIVWAVNPANDTLEGLMTYVCKYAQEYLSVAGIRCRVDVPAQLPGMAVLPDLRHHVFLAFKEAVTNVVRHAGASAAWVRLRVEPALFVLEIEDNGRGLAGLDEQAAQTRNGLRNMRRRMEEIGGQFSLTAVAGGGAVVRLTAPLKSPD